LLKFLSKDTSTKKARKPKMCVELKIKLKSLDAEAKIIKKEEDKLLAYARYTKGADQYKKFEEVRRHRKWDVRLEARATHLAYGMLRGRSFKEIEKHTPMDLSAGLWPYLIPKMAYMVAKYGNVKEAKLDWKSGKPQGNSSSVELVKNWIVGK
jgi:hypothetical protein